MALQGLVACSSASLLERIVPCLDVAGIAAAICGEAEDAERRVATGKYDAVVVDCENLDGRQTLQQVRQSPSNRNCVTFAIAEPPHPAESAANFLISPHFTSERLLQALQCARTLMLAEQLRYYRHPVSLMARLSGGGRHPDHPAPICNLSQGGMAIRPSLRLSLGNRVELNFQLPGTKPILAEAKVIWTADDGAAGVEFTRVTREAKQSLVSWLSEQWLRNAMPLPPIPPSLEIGSTGSVPRLLHCHAFLKQLPVAWRCSQCRWQAGIPVQESSWRYEHNPPRAIVEAFERHACAQHLA